MNIENRNKSFISTLKRELMPALGCTEPIAIAYVCAKARDVLEVFPDKLEVLCSGNIVKNVKGVVVPNSNGNRGIDIAAVLGVVGGNSEKELEVLHGITDTDIEKAKKLISDGFVKCALAEGVANLYVKATAYAGSHSASVTIENHHTNIVEIIKDGKNVFSEKKGSIEETDWTEWSLDNILDFVRNADISPLYETLNQQIQLNSQISDEGLKNSYGAEVGKTIFADAGNNVRGRAKARAAAGSDARMGGCSLPVVINSGSGNQGITVTLPVLEYAKEFGSSKEQTLRALTLSNLLSVYQKHYIGSLSAFCGAVTAACGSGAAITFLAGGDDEAIGRTITNTLNNTGGIVCDGAKSSCAAKISAAVDSAITAHQMSMKNLVFKPGEGIISDNIEQTIKNVGYMGKVGMKETDLVILHLMLNDITP